MSLSVSDHDRSMQWYRDVLGFELVFQESHVGRGASVMRFAGGGFSVGLTQHEATDAHGFDPARIGLDHVAFRSLIATSSIGGLSR